MSAVLTPKAAQRKRWAEQNPEKYAARKDRYKQRKSDLGREWRQKNPHRVAAYSVEYRTAMRGATPSWADEFEMECVYKLAAAYRSIGLHMHVDHIVPLQGKTVCGLHTPDNLQILGRAENIRKSNRHWPDMP